MSLFKNGKVKAPSNVPPKKTLSKEDLDEFRLRYSLFQSARKQALMIAESYQMYNKSIAEKYGIAPEFDVNLGSGEINEKRGVGG